MKALIKYISLLIVSGLILLSRFNPDANRLPARFAGAKISHRILSRPAPEFPDQQHFSFLRDVVSNIFPQLKKFN